MTTTTVDHNWQEVLNKASMKATEAWKSAVPEAMVVTNNEGQRWVVSEGPCGFSYVIVKDGRSAFVRHLRKHNIGRKHYYGGWEIPSWQLVAEDRASQSYQRKGAATQAAVELLAEYGIQAYSMSRYD